jgi:ubiquinone/menaquinone biosynthesis C-methylase UbiE/ADP-ribose pyrophosphatase YjhB (NUDIX family)
MLGYVVEGDRMPEQHRLQPAGQVRSQNAIQCWDEAAEEFASYFADGGDRYHAHIINPCLLELLGDVEGKTILDLACGEGHFARQLAKVTKGRVRVVGVDASQTMIRIAQERSTDYGECLTFQLGDAADLGDLPPHSFDVVVCNMALMDMQDYAAAISQVARVLRPGGAFVFSILHPCFFTPGCGWLQDDEGDITGWRVGKYYSQLAWKWTVKHVMASQTFMFHRPLQDYARVLRDNGFVFVDLREPAPSAELIERWPRWQRELERGGFLVVRCVLPAEQAADAEQQYPEPTVGALILDRAGRLFLTRAHKWRDKYVVPGGHVELGESLEDALRREIKEETGLDIYDIQFLCFQEFVFDEVFWKPSHFIFFDHVCRTDCTQVRLNDEAQEYVWVSPEEALELPLEPYTETAIRAYLKKLAEGSIRDGG